MMKHLIDWYKITFQCDDEVYNGFCIQMYQGNGFPNEWVDLASEQSHSNNHNVQRVSRAVFVPRIRTLEQANIIVDQIGVQAKGARINVWFVYDIQMGPIVCVYGASADVGALRVSQDVSFPPIYGERADKLQNQPYLVYAIILLLGGIATYLAVA
jgi:hypothetical protein